MSPPGSAAHVLFNKFLLPVAAVILLAMPAGCSRRVSAAACTSHDIGPFSICTPPAWVLVQGRSDSAAGHFASGDLRIDYDFGLYAAPVVSPAGAESVATDSITIQERTGARVAYSVPGAVRKFYLAFHIPEVSRSSMGRIRLTLLASSPNAGELRAVDEAVASIRFKTK